MTTLRTRIGLPMVLAAVVPALVLGGLASMLLHQNLSLHRVRTVGHVAQGKHEMLHMLLAREHDRGNAFLQHIANRCLRAGGRTDAACATSLLRTYVAAEAAIGATLLRDAGAAAPLTVDAGLAPTAASLDWKPGQLAAFVAAGSGGNQAYFIAVGEARSGLELRVVYPSAVMRPIFDRPDELGESGETFLSDGEGYFVTPARYQSAQGHSHPIHARPMQLCLSGRNAEMADRDYRDADVIHGFRFVPEFGAACIMAHIDRTEALAPLGSLSAWVYVAIAAFLLAVASVAAQVAKAVARPLSQLSQAVRDYAEGRQPLPVPVHGSDEIAELANSFNRMTLRLDALKRELQAEHAARVQDSIFASRRLMAIQEEERRRLSAELHDQTSPNLAALVINLKRIETTLAPQAAEPQRRLLHDTSQLLRETMESVRQISASLRPTTLDYGGLWPALESYAQQFSRRTGIAVRSENQGADERLPGEVETCLFRIAQEAMTNAAKHAQAKNIALVLARREDGVELQISDDGVGFDAKTLERPGHGLVTMRERASFAGCSWSLESVPGQGTRMAVLYPHKCVTEAV